MAGLFLCANCTYSVTVPADTKACFIAGPFNEWSQVKMKRENATAYTAAGEHVFQLEAIPKPLLAAIGCNGCGSALSAKKVLDVHQHACEPFSPAALSTPISLDLA